MKVIKPSFKILDPENINDGVRKLSRIEHLGRISHRSEDKRTPDSWQRFIPAVVMEHGDWSIVEHATATVVFRVDRGVTHELVRHRLFSFTQESTRFVNGKKNYPEGLEFIYPEHMSVSDSGFEDWGWRQAMSSAETEYFNLLENGVRPQEARSVLPNALAATIAVTGNLRNWRHFFLMRTSKETHPDFKAVTVPLLEKFKERIPLLYDDIEPEQRQIDNLRKAR